MITHDKSENSTDPNGEEPDSPRVWYFAYGASMNPKSLEAMGIHPTRSVAATLNLYLNFEMLVVPYMEPCFPSLGAEPVLPDQPLCHGVAFEITEQEFRYIRLKQSGNCHAGLGYELSEMQCHSYAGDTFVCKVLRIAHPRPLNVQPFPSQRYLESIEAGALAHELDHTYRAWLRSVPRYGGPTTRLQKIGKVLFLLIFMPPMSLAIMLNQCWKPKQSPRFIHVFLDRLRHPIWWSYEHVFRPVFGPGAGEVINEQGR